MKFDIWLLFQNYIEEIQIALMSDKDKSKR